MANSERPAITVVVTIYNLGNYLLDCLKSLQEQTLTNFEALLVDDHSTDGSDRVVDEWVANDSRFIAVHLPTHSGVSAARNYGLDHTSADLICFVDGDDTLEPTYLATFVEGMADHSVDLVTVGYRWGGWSRDAVAGLHGWQEISQDDMLAQATAHGTQIGGYTWNKVFRMSVVSRLQLRFNTHLQLAEDLLFTADYVAGAKKFLFNPLALYNKVSRPNSTIHTATRSMRRIEMEVNDHIEQLRNND